MSEAKEKSVFDILNAVDVNDKKETRNGLTYLSWAWAWTEVKKRFPDANYKVYENDMGFPYHTDGRTAWVKCGVTIQGVEQIEYLSVMDYRNTSIPLEKVTSVDVIKTIQRCVTKAIGRHGLGLYIYAKEDLPEEAKGENASQEAQNASKNAKKAKEAKQPIQELPSDYCTICHLPVMPYDAKDKEGKVVAHYPKSIILEKSIAEFGSPVCMSCWMKKKARDKAKAEKKALDMYDGEYQALIHEDAGDRV